MSTAPPPLVSLALPLYRSARFLEIITTNLDTFEYPNLEILVSDRHCADDTLDVLRARYGRDPRFVFFKATDELNWVEHYDFLSRMATGKYLLWMPHDDSYPANYIHLLAQALENYPDALGAYGKMCALYADGRTECHPRHPAFSNEEPWGMRNAMRMYMENHIGVAFHGLFRREALDAHGLWIRTARDTYASDMIWVFAAACLGRLVWVPACSHQKRFYPTSTHAQWGPRTLKHRLDELVILHSYLGAPKGTRERLRVGVMLGFWAVVRLGADALKRLHAHRLFHGPLVRLFLACIPARVRQN